jgi:hypothetical protein
MLNVTSNLDYDALDPALAPVWTGAPGQNCSNWSSTSGRGSIGFINDLVTQFQEGTVSCASSGRLFCLER